MEEAMAIINPYLCRSLTIQVEIEQGKDSAVPHLRVYHDKTRNPRRCSYIKLDEVGYAPHHDTTVLPANLKEQFIKLMSLPANDYMKDYKGNLVELNGYQSAVKIWVETFEDNYDKFSLDEKGVPVTLDYSSL